MLYVSAACECSMLCANFTDSIIVRKNMIWAFTRLLPRAWHGVYGEEYFASVPRCQTPPTPPVVPCWWKLSCILKSTQWSFTPSLHTPINERSQPAISFLLPARRYWHFSGWSISSCTCALIPSSFTATALTRMWLKSRRAIQQLYIFFELAITSIIPIASSALRSLSLFLCSFTDNSQ